MDIQKLEWFPYEKRYWYPHMGPKDREIWERFLVKYPDVFDKCAYDVAVGGGIGEEELAAAGLPAAQNRLYQRKIDVLGYASNILTIIELKPRASTAAIGQVEAYGLLLKRDYGYTGDLRLMIVTDILIPEMEFLAKNKGVNIFVV